MALTALATALPGCHGGRETLFNDYWRHYQQNVTDIEYADAQVIQDTAVHTATDPHTVRNPEHKEFWDLTLDAAVAIAMENSEAMRDIGGFVVASPFSTRTIYDPAIQEADPLSGVEAALSQFDAQFNTALIFTHNERTFNNVFFGGGARSLLTNNATFQTEISKTAATGTSFAFRNITTRDDSNNDPEFIAFQNYYETLFTAEFRHPLLQGGGLEFNRIAGPNARPGVYNGVLLARINTDVALADFELAVRDLVRDVEQAYWDLHFAYRDLDARRTSRDAALEIWRYAETRSREGAGDPADTAVALSQFYGAQATVEENLGGSLSLGAQGLFDLERRLRRLMGLTATDERLIRPIDEPTTVEVRFDWNDSLAQAFYRRAELRRQQWQIKRRELELVAARNFRLMRLDVVGGYTWRGFGDKLLGDGSEPNTSAFQDLFDGNLQDWQAGLQLSTPIGNRIGYTAIRHAELQLARERAIYREQERAISYELADAFSDLDRAYTLARTNFNRRAAAQEELRVRTERYQAGRDPINFVLEALQRVTMADIAYHRARADYNLALMQIHYARGTLLDLHGVQLAEGPWTPEAHAAALKEARRFGPYIGNQCFEEPCPISVGPSPEPLAPGFPVQDNRVTPETLSMPPQDPANGPLPEAPPTPGPAARPPFDSPPDPTYDYNRP